MVTLPGRVYNILCNFGKLFFREKFFLLCAGVFQSAASCARAERAEQAGLRFTAMVFAILADGNKSYISKLFPKQQRLAALARLEIAKVFFGAFMLFQARLLGCATAAVNKSASYHSFYKQLFIIRSVALAE